MKLFPLLLILCATLCSAQTDFWQKPAGPPYGQIDVLARDSSGGIYAARNSPYLYHSSDEGRSWSEIGITPGSISSLAIGRDGLIVASLYSNVRGGVQGLVVSRDRGRTWDTLHKTGNFARSAVLAPDGTILFVSGSAILRRSASQQNWTTLLILPSDISSPVNRIRGITLTPAGDLFAATEAGVYRSTNFGSAWTPALAGLNDSIIRAVVPAGDNLYATGKDSTVYRSTDRGDSWTLLPVTGQLPVVSSGSDDRVVIGMLDGRVFREQSRGGEWTLSTAPELFVTALVELRPGVVIAGSTINNLYRSGDGGGHWEISNRGTAGSTVASIAVAANGTIYAGLIQRDSGMIYSSTDGGDTWKRNTTTTKPAGIWCMVALPNGSVMAGTEGTGIYRTTDDGEIWTAQNNGLSNLTIRSLAVRPNGTVLAGTEGAGVFQSTDNGVNWRQTTLDRFQYWALAVHPDGTLLAGASSGPIHYSTDDGVTWTSVSRFGATTDIQALSVAADGSIYAATFQSGLFRSTDVGRSWKPTTMTDKLLFSVVSTPTGETWIGGEGGVRRTLDGITFDTVNSGAGNFWVESLARDSSGHLLAGTSGNGLFRSNGRFSSVHEPSRAEAATSLRIMPNPVAGRSTIRLTIDRSGNARLRIYDMLGQPRATLLDGSLSTGGHDFEWPAGLEAGHYYCVLEIGGRISSVAVEVR